MKNLHHKYFLTHFALILLLSPIIFGFTGESTITPKVGEQKMTGEKETLASNENLGQINWMTIDEAYELNKKSPKKIFVDVYTDWCGWCKRMDKTTFVDKEVSDYANEHFYAVKLDAESSENISLHEANTTPRNIARSMQVNSFPTIVFIEEDFKTISVQPGYRTAKEFLDFLKQFNDKKYRRKARKGKS